jgi:decaprenylphosphoryl-5-phosphoribose phosphatase
VDLALLRLLRTRGHTPALDSGARVLARAGENGAVWLVLSLRNRRAFTTVLGALLANTAIKQVVRRVRPDLGPDLPPLSSTISSLSYPSAHAATSFAGAGALGGGPLYAAAGLMAFTRLYLGVHYPSDVIAGAALGWAVEKLASGGDA